MVSDLPATAVSAMVSAASVASDLDRDQRDAEAGDCGELLNRARGIEWRPQTYGVVRYNQQCPWTRSAIGSATACWQFDGKAQHGGS